MVAFVAAFKVVRNFERARTHTLAFRYLPVYTPEGEILVN